MATESVTKNPPASPSSNAAEHTDKEAVTTPSSITGKLVTETFKYDGGRQVTVYVPPTTPEAIVFVGDGQLISQWGSDLETANVPPTVIVGTHRLDDEMQRLHEYSPVFD